MSPHGTDSTDPDLRLEAPQPDPLLQTTERASPARVAAFWAAILLIVGVVFYGLTHEEPPATARAPSAATPPATASNAAPSGGPGGQAGATETTGQGPAPGSTNEPPQKAIPQPPSPAGQTR